MPEGKYFYIKSRMNGLVLDIQGGSSDRGTQVFMWDKKDPDDDADNQLFFVDPIHGCIRTKLDDDMCLEIDDDDNKLVINRYDDGNDNQQWNIVGERIVNRNDHQRVLDVAQRDDEERARVCAWEFHGDNNQLWDFDYNVEAKYFFIQSELTDLVLDVQEDGRVIMWEKGDGEDHQLWYEDRHGIIHSKKNDFVLDSSKGRSIRMEEFEPGNDGQKWAMIGQRVMNHEDKNCLDVMDACEDRGTDLSSDEFHGGPSQLFRVIHA